MSIGIRISMSLSIIASSSGVIRRSSIMILKWKASAIFSAFNKHCFETSITYCISCCDWYSLGMNAGCDADAEDNTHAKPMLAEGRESCWRQRSLEKGRGPLCSGGRPVRFES